MPRPPKFETPRLKPKPQIALAKPAQRIVPLPIPTSLKEQAYLIRQNDPFWLNKLNQRVYCHDLYVSDPQDEVYARHTNCHLNSKLSAPNF